MPKRFHTNICVDDLGDRVLSSVSELALTVGLTGVFAAYQFSLSLYLSLSILLSLSPPVSLALSLSSSLSWSLALSLNIRQTEYQKL